MLSFMDHTRYKSSIIQPKRIFLQQKSVHVKINKNNASGNKGRIADIRLEQLEQLYFHGQGLGCGVGCRFSMIRQISSHSAIRKWLFKCLSDCFIVGLHET